MHWPAEQTAATSLWRFSEAYRGWCAANGGDGKDKAPTVDDLVAFHERNGTA